MLTEEKDPHPHAQSPQYYQIIVEGKIPESWSDWLGGVQLVSQKEDNEMIITTLSGPIPDQAALRGLLNRLWDLNLVLRAVQPVNPSALSEIK